jgi:hypothetical protein
MEFSQAGGWAPTVGMNDRGLFASCQMLFPEREYQLKSWADELYTWEVFQRALYECASVGDVSELIAGKRVIDGRVSLHNLVADTSGSAIVVETGDGQNIITPIEGYFLVMTNFPLGEFRGADGSQVQGVGATRYKLAYQHIDHSLGALGVKQAFEGLRKAAATGSYPTLASMVFDLQSLEIYVALKRNFQKTWKVSLAGGTIETHAGFDGYKLEPLDASGVTASDLDGWRVPRAVPWLHAAAAIVGLALSGAIATIALRRRMSG